MNKRKRKHLDYQTYLLKSLQDPEEAGAYLNAVLAEGDQQLFLLALKNVIEALGESMTSIAEKADLNRENLYRILSKKGNPKLSSVITLLDAVGLQFTVQTVKQK